MEFVYSLFIFGAVGLVLMCIDGMWSKWLIYKATVNAQNIISMQNQETPSPAELNTMDCQGGQ